MPELLCMLQGLPVQVLRSTIVTLQRESMWPCGWIIWIIRNHSMKFNQTETKYCFLGLSRGDLQTILHHWCRYCARNGSGKFWSVHQRVLSFSLERGCAWLEVQVFSSLHDLWYMRRSQCQTFVQVHYWSHTTNVPGHQGSAHQEGAWGSVHTWYVCNWSQAFSSKCHELGNRWVRCFLLGSGSFCTSHAQHLVTKKG